MCGAPIVAVSDQRSAVSQNRGSKPLLLGGQGRTAAEIEADGSMMVVLWVFGSIAAAVAAVIGWVF